MDRDPGHLHLNESARRSRCGTMLGGVKHHFAHPNRYRAQGVRSSSPAGAVGSSEFWFFCFLDYRGLHTRFVGEDWVNGG
jgi:hypothetical protein